MMRRALISGAVLIAVVAFTAGKLSGASPGPAAGGGAGGNGVSGGGSGAAVVERVVDGDTIVVRRDGRDERVRYIGMDTPESVKPGTPVQCFAKAASAENKRLVEGQRVRLVADREARDRYGRTLAYVYRASDDLFVNAELVRRGYARIMRIPPNTAHATEFQSLATKARRAGLGLWDRC
jgi:micrococcal nuclease